MEVAASDQELPDALAVVADAHSQTKADMSSFQSQMQEMLEGEVRQLQQKVDETTSHTHNLQADFDAHRQQTQGLTGHTHISVSDLQGQTTPSASIMS